jgi:hypothetical protein
MTNNEYFEWLNTQTRERQQALTELLLKLNAKRCRLEGEDLRLVCQLQEEILRLLRRSQKFLKAIVRLDLDLNATYRPEIF